MESEPNAASLAVIVDGRVLLIRRARPPLAGLWTLPGGRREPGETIEQCAIRELREELGLEVSALRPVTRLGVEAPQPFRLQVLATDTYRGTITPADEIAGLQWVRPAEIAALSTTPYLQAVVEKAVRVLSEP